MKVTATTLPDVLLIEPRVFEDSRGFLLESYQLQRYREALRIEFVQDNYSHSRCGVLRGLHYQLQRPQGKLIWVGRGEIFDVAVDLRRESETYGQWTGMELSEANHRQLYIPPGFAHGFCVLSDLADVFYKCSDYYHPESQHTIIWNDPDLRIDWPIDNPVLSSQDRSGLFLRDAPSFSADLLASTIQA